jgi:hypothetical protein
MEKPNLTPKINTDNNKPEESEFSRENALKLIEEGKSKFLLDNFDSFQGLDDSVGDKLLEAKDLELNKKIAFKLIEAGKGSSVANNLRKFKGLSLLDYNQIASALIENKNGSSVACNIDKFQGLDHREIALKIIKEGKGDFVAMNLNKFKDLNHTEIALNIIESGKGEYVAKYLENFNGLDGVIAFKLIDLGKENYVVSYLNKFQNLDHKKLILKLIKDKKTSVLFYKLNDFQGLDEEIACKLIEEGDIGTVAQNLYLFSEFLSSVHYKKLAIRLIDERGVSDLALYLNRFSKLDNEIALKLIEEKESYSVIKNLKSFNQLNSIIALELIKESKNEDDLWCITTNLDYFSKLSNEVAFELIKKGKIDSVACNLSNFTGLNKETALKLMEKNNQLDKLANNLDKFIGLDKEVALKLFEAGKKEDVVNNLEKFEGLDNEIAIKLIEEGPTLTGAKVVENLEKFQGINYKEIALKLIENEEAYVLASELDKFQDIDHREIALKIIEAEDSKYGGQGSSVANFLELFHGLDHNEIAEKILEAGQGVSVGHNIEKFKNLKREFVLKAFNDYIGNWEDDPNDHDHPPIEQMLKINNYCSQPLDKILSKTEELFGDFADYNSYEILKKISNNDKETITKLNLKAGGENGLREIQEKLQKIKVDMLKNDFNPQTLRGSFLEENYFKKQIRFNEAQWTGHGRSFEEILDRFIEICEQYETIPLNKNYTPSETIYIDTVDKSNKGIEYTESFLNRFKIISSDVKKAKEIYLDKKPLTKIIDIITEKLTSIKNAINENIENKNPLNNKQEPLSPQQIEARKKGLQTKLDSLEALKIRNLGDFQKNFTVLSSFKELESDLRQAMFVMGFSKNHTQLEKDLNKIDIKKPNLDDITWMMNFVDHITNKETMSKYFTDKQAQNKFNELINIKSFEEELSRFQNKDKIGTLPMKFIPTRGILMEFSGHIADACWADKYEDTIPATFPNFTAVTMVQNPETKHERISGSCMLIETKNEENGENLLVIRGFNPIENTINQLSVDDFYKKFTSYLKKLAQKDGRKLAIVIDQRSGMAATNRPLLHNYLSELNLQKVPVPYSETEFNGYDISDNVYLVE